ncbi:MAG: hypothetical protein M0007_06420 [Actinomycetota bacterium]|jgi:hypothetical protein|nr:hypothetical protein [Actinomycetota bacterium]
MGVVLALVALVVAGFVVASIFVRRHAESDRPQPGWRPTDELFNDPSTDRVMRVWLDPAGERHYVAEARRKTA